MPTVRKKVADKTTALRLTGDQAVGFLDIRENSAAEGMTVQAWVQPASFSRGAMAYSKRRFTGTSIAFSAGRYDDLSLFPIWSRSGSVGSLRVPPGYSVTLFSGKDCTGQARGLIQDVDDYGQSLDFAAKSMLIIAPVRGAQRYVVAFGDEDLRGPATVLELGRYETLPAAGAKGFVFGSFLIPLGVEVTLYQLPACKGASCQAHGESFDRQGVAPERSLAVTKSTLLQAGVSTPERAEMVLLFCDQEGEGLNLRQSAPVVPTAEPVLSFAGQSLRADKWHHIARTFDGQQVLSYLNGRLVRHEKSDVLLDVGSELIIGRDLYGTIGQVSLHAGVLSRKTIAKGRFDQLDPEDREATGLLAGSNLDGSGNDPIIDVASEHGYALPDGEGFWIAAKLPVSVLDSGLAQKALALAQTRASAAENQAELTAEKRVKKAHDRSGKALQSAHDQAQSDAYASHIRGIFGIVARGLTRVSAEGKAAQYGLLEAILRRAQWNLNDFVRDAATGMLYVIGSSPSQEYAGPGAAPGDHANAIMWADEESDQVQVHVLSNPGLAIGLDNTGFDGDPIMFWVEYDGRIYRRPVHGGPPAEHIHSAIGFGGEQQWSMTFDQGNKRLVWSNGAEIWSAPSRPEPKLSSAHVIVPNGLSPNPIALTVDDLTGDIVWIDGKLDKLRRCNKDGGEIRDLYDAPGATAAIDLDFFDVSMLDAEVASKLRLNAT